ncbi:transposase [Komagataeibacter xylinus E25]|nr:transposase [Komagataeibacter xylinus E25]
MHRRQRLYYKSGVIERIFRHMAADHNNEYMMIDSTIARAHQRNSDTHKKGHQSHQTIV